MTPDELHFTPVERQHDLNFGTYLSHGDEVSPISDASSYRPISRDISTFEGYSVSRPPPGAAAGAGAGAGAGAATQNTSNSTHSPLHYTTSHLAAPGFQPIQTPASPPPRPSPVNAVPQQSRLPPLLPPLLPPPEIQVTEFYGGGTEAPIVSPHEERPPRQHSFGSIPRRPVATPTPPPYSPSPPPPPPRGPLNSHPGPRFSEARSIPQPLPLPIRSPHRPSQASSRYPSGTPGSPRPPVSIGSPRHHPVSIGSPRPLVSIGSSRPPVSIGPPEPPHVTARVRGPQSQIPLWREWWLLEIGAVFFSCICFICIIILLLAITDKPISDWTAPISPHTVIAILTVLGKSALLYAVGEFISQSKWVYFTRSGHPLHRFHYFQAASRGPRGALTFLASMKGAAVFANIGAIIILLALAIDPFTQQVIEYRTRAIAIPGVADLGGMQQLDKYLLPNNTSTDLNVQDAMQASLFSGLFARGTPVPYQCATGNCTWPTFSSLGVCGKCTNVTSTIKSTCQVSSSSQKQCVFQLNSLPNWPTASQSINSIRTRGSNGQVTGTTINTTAVRLRPTVLYDSSFNESQEANDIGLIRFVSVSYGSDLGADKFPIEDVSDCSLNWCSKDYGETTVTDGTIQEKESKDSDLSFAGWTGKLRKDESSVNSSSLYFNLDSQNTSGSTTQSYRINYDTHSDISTLLQGWFTFDITTSTAQSGLVIPPVLYRQRNQLDAVFKSIGNSMTNGLRGSLSATKVHGKSTSMETYYHIAWAWLALPFITIGFAIIGLAATMFQSRKYRVLPWKSADLALLFHPLQGWFEEDLPVNGPDDMLDMASQMRVVFRANANNKLKFLRS